MHHRRKTDLLLARWFAALLLLSLVGLCVHRADADTVTLTWTAPTQREDGTTLAAAEIAAYKFAWSLNGAALATFTVPGTAITYTLSNLSPGKYCFTTATVDTDGQESVPTGEVCRKAKPNPPSNLRAR